MLEVDPLLSRPSQPLLEEAPEPRVVSLLTYACRVLYISLLTGVCFYVFNLYGNGGQESAGWRLSSIYLWHPFFMVLGFTVFTTEALFPFSSHPLHETKPGTQKVWHVFFHSCACISVILALAAMITAKIRGGESVLPASVHSYMGTTCIILYILQAILGMTNSTGPRGAPGSLHRFLGLSVYYIALATTVSGYVQHSEMSKGDIWKICARPMVLAYVTLALLVGLHFRPVVKPSSSVV